MDRSLRCGPKMAGRSPLMLWCMRKGRGWARCYRRLVSQALHWMSHRVRSVICPPPLLQPRSPLGSALVGILPPPRTGCMSWALPLTGLGRCVVASRERGIIWSYYRQICRPCLPMLIWPACKAVLASAPVRRTVIPLWGLLGMTRRGSMSLGH